MNENLTALGQEDKTGQSQPPNLVFDAKKYDAMLDASYTEQEREAFLRILWDYMMRFVDAGFGIESTQLACGKLIESALHSEIEAQNALESSHQPLHNDVDTALQKEGERI